MKTNLTICIASIFVFIVELVYFFIKIGKAKALLKKGGNTVKKAEVAYVSSLILCCLIEILPILIPLQTYVIVIVCLCGILGAYLVLKERLKNL